MRLESIKLPSTYKQRASKTVSLALTFFAFFSQALSFAFAAPLDKEEGKSESTPRMVVHSGTHSDSDYTLSLLRMALKSSGDKYRPQALGTWPPRGRDFTMMERNEGIDIMWGSAREDREAKFQAIRIPIFKGLIGWRVPLVIKDKADTFASVDNMKSLSEFRPGQHFTWTDTKILKHNGINVFEVNNRTSLMDMLVDGKFDYFPRAVIEIEGEYQQAKDRGVIIDSEILLVYPTAFYFYVRKEDTDLASNLQQGLENLIASGEMDTLFAKHFADIIGKLDIQHRRIFRLANPYIPDTAPFDRAELWLDPENLDEIFH